MILAPASSSPQTMTPTSQQQQNGHAVALTSTTTASSAAAAAATTTTTSAGSLALPEICHSLRRKVLAFLEQQPDGDDLDVRLRSTQQQARASIAVVEEALRRYTPEQLSLSYNGGKDCLVLLILILACLPAIHDPLGPNATASITSTTSTSNGNPHTKHAPPEPPPRSLSVPTIQAIYIAPPDPFPEVDDFVTSSTKEYHLDLTRYALPMRQALEAYQADRPSVKAIFMGTRRTDPFSEFLETFAPTDHGWPQFMRVNPILDWHYADIWAFIRGLDIPFCSLYQQGYSSLGGVKNTRPNPALAVDAEGTQFRPAYELVRDDEERLGRDK